VASRKRGVSWHVPRAWVGLVALAVGVGGVVACAPAPTPPLLPAQELATEVPTIADAQALERYLTDAGVVLPVARDLRYDWFDQPGHTYEFSDSDALMVHTYPDAAAAEAEAARVSVDGKIITRPDGQRIRVEWPGPPRFYRHDAMLVVYVGNDRQILHLLSLALGPQFAGPIPPSGVGVR